VKKFKIVLFPEKKWLNYHYVLTGQDEKKKERELAH